MTSKAKWEGTLYFSNGWAHYRGPAGDGTFHAHYVHQLVFAGSSPVKIRIEGEPDKQDSTLFIPSNTRHQLQAYTNELDILYIEPTVLKVLSYNHTLSLKDQIKALSQQSAPQLDPRITNSLTLIDQKLSGKIYVADIAKQAGLSQSHFNTLFRQATNVPLRRYVLWRRLNIAGLIVMQGGTVTEAAHTAGFSDAAHFNRTMKSTFGVSPGSSLFNLKLSAAPDVTLPRF